MSMSKLKRKHNLQMPKIKVEPVHKSTVINKATKDKQKAQAVKVDIANAVKAASEPLIKIGKIVHKDIARKARREKKKEPKKPKAKRRSKLQEYRDAESPARPVSSPKSLRDFKEKAKFRESKDRGSLLQQYKDTKETLASRPLPTMREVGWENFKQALNELPDEIQIDFKNTIDYLISKYGEEPVAYYLDKRGLLETTSVYHGIDYKSMVARIYLYQLAAAVDYLATGELSGTGFDELQDEALWMSTYSIQNTVSEKKRPYFESLLEVEKIQNINLVNRIDDFFESEYGEDYR